MISQLVRSCRIDSSSVDLPEIPGKLIPVDPIDIGPGEDSISIIVTDRLNVALRGVNQDVNAFARAFKTEYPNEVYRIIYYDTMTYRIQLQVPKNEREQIKEELPEKLTDFQMLIWNEGLFQSSVGRATDPDLLDARKSWHLEVIKAPQAWEKSLGKEDIIIAIIDNGFDLAHPELSNRYIKPYNVVERSTNVFTNPVATHGSHVASLAVAERDNAAGICGVSPRCKFIPIQVSDQNDNITTTAIIDAVLYAINSGADVINLSLGKKVKPSIEKLPVSVQQDMIQNSFHAEEAFWDDIFEIAEESKTTLVIAAGNQHVLVGLDPMQRNSLGIKVNAIDRSLNGASFSNYGAFSTVSAPGVEVYSALPQNSYGYLDGTSMAAPIVSGAVGLIKAVRPTLNTREIIDLLVSTGRKVVSNMGPLIQLDKALDIDDANLSFPIVVPDYECEYIQEAIDSLQREIARLKDICQVANGLDTLMIPEQITELDFLSGRWRSTTTLLNDEEEEIVLYFDLRIDGSGRITYVEPGNDQCHAAIRLNNDDHSFEIIQNGPAVCRDVEQSSYQGYDFSCTRGVSGIAECMAQNQQFPSNQVSFKLVKI